MKRVVVTGVGVIAPNGSGKENFANALKAGKSGVKIVPQLHEWNQGCQIAGIPEYDESGLKKYIKESVLSRLKSSSIKIGCLTVIEAWHDAGLDINSEVVDWETGCVFGTMSSDYNVINEVIDTVEAKEYRKMGTRFVEQVMFSGTSAYIAGILGLGNHSYANSAACATGNQAIVLSYERIKHGKAKRMVAGGSESVSPYLWACADATGVLCRDSNNKPEAGSRPLSSTAAGFVPAGGGGALILEELEFAVARGARIYAEIIGAAINSGGHRNGGSMTAPNVEGVKRCISSAVESANISPDSIDLICGHLTSTLADRLEIRSWSEGLNRSGNNFPLINAPKSMIGHSLGAAGAIESIAAILQLHQQFVHPSINCSDVHPEILGIIDGSRIPQTVLQKELNIVIKANFGFGDVNSSLVFSKFNKN